LKNYISDADQNNFQEKIIFIDSQGRLAIGSLLGLLNFIETTPFDKLSDDILEIN
jgi:hypothetical protein